MKTFKKSLGFIFFKISFLIFAGIFVGILSILIPIEKALYGENKHDGNTKVRITIEDD